MKRERDQIVVVEETGQEIVDFWDLLVSFVPSDLAARHIQSRDHPCSS